MKTLRLVPLAIVSLSLLAPPLIRADEDEWYDPRDWFDGNNWDYDSETSDRWGFDEWDDDWYDASYWDDYDWYEAYSDEYYDDLEGGTLTYIIVTDPADRTAAADNRSRQGQRSGGQSGGRSQDAQSSGRATLAGTIEGIRQMKLKRTDGQTGTYTLAKVSLENGRTTVVNLGEQGQLKGADLSRGDRIEAVGTRGEVGGETVFVAQHLRADGRTFAVNRVFQTGSSPQQSGSGQRQRTIEGQVASFERVTPDQQRDAHTLVKVTLENGKTATIDLGANASLNRINLNTGDSITVRGHETKVGDRRVVRATQLKINGRSAELAAE